MRILSRKLSSSIKIWTATAIALSGKLSAQDQTVNGNLTVAANAAVAGSANLNYGFSVKTPTATGATPQWAEMLTRAGSAVTDGLYLGMDGNAAGVIAVNNAPLRFGTVTTGTFTEAFNIQPGPAMTIARNLTVNGTGYSTFGGPVVAPYFLAGGSSNASFAGIVATNTSSGGAALAYDTVSNGTNNLNIVMAGTGYSGALSTGGPSGTTAAIYTNNSVPLTIGTNGAAVITIDTAQRVDVDGANSSAWDGGIGSSFTSTSATTQYAGAYLQGTSGRGIFLAQNNYVNGSTGGALHTAATTTGAMINASSLGNSTVGTLALQQNGGPATFGGTLTVAGSGTATFAGPISSSYSYSGTIAAVTRTGINGAGSASVFNVGSDAKTANDTIELNFAALDSSSAPQLYSSIETKIVSPTAGALSSALNFYTWQSGANAKALSLNGPNATVTGNLSASGTTASTSTTTGALVVGSNVGLSGNSGGSSYFGGPVSVAGTLAAGVITSTAQQAGALGFQMRGRASDGASELDFTDNGGAAAYGFVGANAYGAYFGSRSTLDLVINRNNGAAAFGGAVASTSPTTGALVVGTNIGLSGNAAGPSYFGGDIYLPTNTAGLWLGSSAPVTGIYSSGGEFRIRTNTTDQVKVNSSNGAVTLSGSLSVTSAAAGTSATTGALVVGSNVGLSGNSGGTSYFGGPVSVAGALTAANGLAGGATGPLSLTAGGANGNVTISSTGSGTTTVNGLLQAHNGLSVSPAASGPSLNVAGQIAGSQSLLLTTSGAPYWMGPPYNTSTPGLFVQTDSTHTRLSLLAPGGGGLHPIVEGVVVGGTTLATGVTSPTVPGSLFRTRMVTSDGTNDGVDTQKGYNYNTRMDMVAEGDPTPIPPGNPGGRPPPNWSTSIRFYTNNASGSAQEVMRLSSQGIVEAQEVIVQPQNGWSDYVFSPGYRLAPLAEVAKAIRADKHLPGMPSATDVRSSGVKVGEMEALLLQKVEELTLHLIEQQAHLAKAEQESVRLESRIERLETENAQLRSSL